MCFFRMYSKENPDRWAAPIAGLVAGTWLSLDPVSSRRNLVTILVLAKAIDCIINIIIRYFAKFNSPECQQIETNDKLSITKNRLMDFLLIGSSAWCALTYFYDQSILHRSLYKLYKEWGVMHINDHALLPLVDDPIRRKPKYII